MALLKEKGHNDGCFKFWSIQNNHTLTIWTFLTLHRPLFEQISHDLSNEFQVVFEGRNIFDLFKHRLREMKREKQKKKFMTPLTQYSVSTFVTFEEHSDNWIGVAAFALNVMHFETTSSIR
jgi:hypothetical protein